MNKTARHLLILASVLSLAPAGRAWADGGSVLPAVQDVDGYSLADAAQATAVYNTGIQAGNPATPPAPNLPFDVLVGDTSLSPNTYIYLPIFDADNSAPVPPNFPSSITDQAADASFLDSYVLSNYGVTAFIVQVDGQTTVLDDTYITGVTTPTLLDGTPGGDEYISSSAFLTPLSPGDHTIGIGGLISGQPQTFLSYSVDVVPEPAPWFVTGLVGLAACIIRRNRGLSTIRMNKPEVSGRA
jgi:hypothetical protein